MPDRSPSKRQERAEYVAEWRRQGWTWIAIAADFQRRYRMNPRVAFRTAHDWSQRDVAEQWNARWPDDPKAAKNISYWETWPQTGHEPSLTTLTRLAQLYECGVGDLVADLPNYRHLDIPPAAPHADGSHLYQTADRAYGAAPTCGLPLPSDPDTEQRDAMERRRLLQWAAAGLTAGAAGMTEPVRQLLDLAITTEPRSADDWHITAADQLNALASRPPAQVRDDLVIDLLALRRQLERTPKEQAVELYRVASMLSCLHANVLTRLADHGAAIRWWRTARVAADTSGDSELGLLARVEEAGFGLYGQRDLRTVQVLIDQAEQVAGSGPSVGLVKLISTRAKTLSLLGRHSDAHKSLEDLAELHAADMPTPWPGYWTDGQLHFTQSWVYAASGTEAAAANARADLLHATDDYQYGANIQLHQAMCAVVNGGVDQGARQAATVLHDLPAAYRSNMILETGKMVLRSVPMDNQQRPAVADLREVLIAV